MSAAGHETTRRLVHAGMGGLAFVLAYLTPPQAAALAGGAILFNLWVLPRLGGGRLFRPGERRAPWKSGIILYPASVLILIVLFHDRMEVAAAAWVMMAAGDAAAGWAGRRFGGARLPWNRTKTAAGTTAFALASGPAMGAVLVWMGRTPAEAAWMAASACLFGAFVESLPWRLDDNLTVPILGALFLAGLAQVETARLAAARPDLARDALVGAAVNLAVAVLFRRLGSVTRSGMIAGFAVGALTWAFAGWRGYAVLLAFFLLGTATTRMGLRRKKRAGIAHETRSARHALANCGVAVYLAFLSAAAGAPAVFLFAFVCAYATAAFDTVSAEIGEAYGGRPVLITTLRRVAPGTDGAVSFVGTLAGLAAALAVAGLAAGLGLLDAPRIGIVLAAAFAGSTVDSVLGATLEARGLMDNESVNFSNTLIGALAGIGLLALVPGA
jgi:uncharacterized protein (TIGR00297 family)